MSANAITVNPDELDRLHRIEAAARAHVEAWQRFPDDDVPDPEDTIDALGRALSGGSL